MFTIVDEKKWVNSVRNVKPFWDEVKTEESIDSFG